MKADIYNKLGKKTSKKIELNKNVFGINPNEHSIYLTIKSERAASRQGTASSKTRSQVRGGGTKPWKQKGTGRARIGSLRNPSRVHGGVAFGPEPRDYSLKVNKKTKTLARKSVLSLKVNENNFIILEDFNLDTSKTKDLIKILISLKIDKEKIIIISSSANNIYLSSRNLKNVVLRNINSFSTYDILAGNFLLIDKDSVNQLNEKF